MTETMTSPLGADVQTLDEPTCRHGYRIDHDSPDLRVGGRADVLDAAHRLICPRPAVFWHPRWRWMEYAPAVERLGLVLCCVGCGERVT